MDHLKLNLGEAFRPLYYGNDFSTVRDFHEFPRLARAGWIINDDLKFSPTSETLSEENVNDSFNKFIQSWLFFGLLATVINVKEWDENYHMQFLNSDSTKIDTTKLEGFLVEWEENEKSTPQGRSLRMFEAQVALDRAREIVHAYCSTDGIYSEMSPQSPTKIDDKLGLSLMVLGETLANAKSKISKMVNFNVRGWNAGANEGWGTPPIVVRTMNAEHWCKKTIQILKGQLNSHATALLSAYSANSEDQRIDDHSECTNEKCIALSSDRPRSYETKHSPECSIENCKEIGPDTEKLIKCIDDGLIPLLEYKQNTSDRWFIDVVPQKPFMRYTTISHVWSHGYGNSKANKLFACQLRLFNRLLQNQNLKGSKSERLLFWIDTLALPVGQQFKYQRRKAVRQIRKIYTDAKFTIVIDNGLKQMSAGAKYSNTAMKILASAWMRQLWTLTEACLSRNLLFAFADGVLKSIDDRDDLYQEASDILVSDVPAIARNCLHQNLGFDIKGKISGTAQASALANIIRAAQWRTLVHPEHETLAIATLLNIDYDLYEDTMSIAPAEYFSTDAPGLDPWDSQRKLGLDNMMRDFWVILDETCPDVIPPGIIFLPGERLSVPDFGWAPRTWLSEQGVDYPDPLSSMVSPAKFITGKGLQVQYPGFLLYFNSANAILFSVERHVEFPIDSSLLEWYQVEQADIAAIGKSTQSLSTEKVRRLAIILCRGKPRELAEIALLVEIVKDIPQRSSTGQTLSQIYKVDIISRVWIKRQRGISYNGKLQDFNHRAEEDKDSFICGEELDAGQQWYIGGSSHAQNTRDLSAEESQVENSGLAGIAESVLSDDATEALDENEVTEDMNDISDNEDTVEQNDTQPFDAEAQGRTFIKSSDASELLREKVRGMVKMADESRRKGESTSDLNPRAPTEIQTPEESLPSFESCQTRKQLFSETLSNYIASLGYFCFALFRLLIFYRSEKQPQSGMKRVKWTCWCGEQLYDDFINTPSGALQELEAALNSYCQTGKSGHTSSSLGGLWSNFLRMFSSSKSGKSNMRATPGDLPTHNAAQISQSTASQPSNTANSTYLLLCIGVGQSGTKVYQERLHGVKCDRTLFSFLSEAYQRRRRVQSWICLRTVTSVELVKFFVDVSHYCDLQLHDQRCRLTCTCLPPPDRVTPGTTPNAEYECEPVPARTVPPVGKNYMMHYFRKSHRILPTSIRLFNQVPKRLEERLEARPDDVEEAWGVYFQEGWHWEVVFGLLLLVGFAGSMLFGIMWSVYQRDIQGAFGIASYWVTATGSLIAFIAARQV